MLHKQTVCRQDLKTYYFGRGDKEGTNFYETLKIITHWANTWQLPISTDKSKWLFISNSPVQKPSDLKPMKNEFRLAGSSCAFRNIFGIIGPQCYLQF